MLAKLVAAKDRLKSVETKVTTASGRQYFEHRDAKMDEFFRTNDSPFTVYGFVPDLKPDLHLAEITPYLFVGSQDVAQCLDSLQSKGITHILNVATGIENHFPRRFKYKQVRMYDTPEFDILPRMQSCFDFIEEARQDNGKVLCHCNAGASRSVAVAVAYLMAFKGFNLETALQRVKEKRSCACPNAGFMLQLKQFEEQCANAANISNNK